MLIHNKYYLYYYNIIDSAKSRVLSKDVYVERHHIIPKSLGGSNDKENIVKLTAKEHLVCHRLLVKMTKGVEKSKMAYAAWRMVFSCNKHKRYKVSSRTYESIRLLIAETTRQRNKNRKHSAETKRKISESKLGKKRTITPEWRENIRLSQLGLKKSPCSAERKQKISQAKTGVKLGPATDEHKRKVSESKKGKKLYTDPVTGKRYMAYPHQHLP